MDDDCAEDLSLGDPIDLWAGLEPRFPSSSGLPWRLPQGRPVRTEPAGVPSDPVEWGPPSLSLHLGVAELLSGIFDYSVSPMVGLDGPHDVTAGALMAGGRLAGLEARLKMDLTLRPAAAYLLVRLTGVRGTRYYTPEWLGMNRKTKIVEWLTPEGRNAMARLRLDETRHEGHEFYGDFTARQARRYLAYFHGMGTHIIRSVSHGERLFQVFEVDEDLLPGLKDHFARELADSAACGAFAFGMARFTRAPWVTNAGPILAASDGAAAREVARHEIWKSDEPDEPPSLLSPRALPSRDRTAVLDGLPARTIVAVGFASQALYMEDHRADAWSRIMRAGLCQRFPALRLTGWRERDAFPIAAFLATAPLTPDEALCRPAAPVLPEIALVLDLTAPGEIGTASADCLAIFAATNPGTGSAAELQVDSAGFDPAELKIPFLDGAACFTDRKGGRYCLVEGVLLGPADGGRPGVAGAPAEPGAAMLTRHAERLAAYARLMGRVQGAAFPPEAGAAMRRSAGWLAEAASRQPGLDRLRWQALQAERGVGPEEPGTLELDDPLKGDLAGLLGSCLDLVALPADSAELGAAAQRLDGRLRAFYRGLPIAREAAELDRRSLAAAEALQRRFAGFPTAPNLPEPAELLFAAGATLCGPPDPRRMPHGVLPDDNPYSTMWNGLLGLRARYAESRAILLALQGRTADAVALLEREVIGGSEGPSNPARAVLSSLDALSGDLPHVGAGDKDALLADMTELLELCGSIRFLQLASGGDGEGAETGPQLRRLLVSIELLQLCMAAKVPLAPLDSLAPTLFAARIDQALRALAGRPPSA